MTATPAPPGADPSCSRAAGCCSALDVLRQLGTAEPPPSGIRFLLGYAGWGPGQLEDELALGAWIVAPVNREAVFGMAPETIWGNIWLDLGINPATLVSSPGVH